MGTFFIDGHTIPVCLRRLWWLWCWKFWPVGTLSAEETNKGTKEDTKWDALPPHLCCSELFFLETGGEMKSGFSLLRGATFLKFWGSQINRKWKKCWGHCQGYCMWHFYGGRPPSFGACSMTLAIMELKILARRLTGCRRDETKHKERDEVRRLAPICCSEMIFLGDKWTSIKWLLVSATEIRCNENA